MSEPWPVIRGLEGAVEQLPDDVHLRLHLARVLLDAGEPTKALAHCSRALQLVPLDREAAEILELITETIITGRAPTPSMPPAPDRSAGGTERGADMFDWELAEQQMRELVGEDRHGPEELVDRQRPDIRLADVHGMEHVKRDVQEAFLLPMANPALRAAYGAAVGGGLLLYGPPGCGKTYLGRALAGELGANFCAVTFADVLDAWLGHSERNVRSIFENARANRPSVIFLDEVDAIGQKRSNLRASPAIRGTVNQLLSELDGAQGRNEGVFVLAASNQPWDIDSALRRPGRFDRTLFVPPPDAKARRAILDCQLAGRLTEGIDTRHIAKVTKDYSGADLVRLCEVASRRALVDAARNGGLLPVGMAHLLTAVTEVRPTTREWFFTARNVVNFANQDGAYDDLDAYMRAKKT